MPPVIAIALVLLTKEVYVSLLIGILSGTLLYNQFHILDALETTFTIISDKVGSNTNILIFLVLLGMLVSPMSKSGVSRAYGDWASHSIDTRRGASLATAGLGARRRLSKKEYSPGRGDVPPMAELIGAA